MKFYKCVSKTGILMLWLGVLLSLATLLIFSKECKDGALSGIWMCLGVLVPSLFPFILLSSIVAKICADQRFSRIFNPLSRLLTSMNGSSFIPVFLSILGGYPVGARCTAELYKSGAINEEEAKRLGCICCCAGPGFLVNFLGVSILKNKEAGFILLCSQIISVVLICVCSRFVFGKHSNSCSHTKISKTSSGISEILVSSVNSTVKTSAAMCGFVIAFSVLCSIVTEGFGISGSAGRIIISLIEITTGLSNTSSPLSLEIISALAGFGGICVHMQIFRELKGIRFSKLRFFIFRFIQASLCFVSTKILLLIFPISTDVFSNISSVPVLTFYSGVTGCFALVAASMLFVLSLRNKHP